MWSPNWLLHGAHQRGSLNNWKSLKYKWTLNLINFQNRSQQEWIPALSAFHFIPVICLAKFFFKTTTMVSEKPSTTTTTTPHTLIHSFLSQDLNISHSPLPACLSLVFYTELYWHIHQCWHRVSVTLANFGHMNNSLRLTQESEEQSLKSSGITSWSCSISQLGPTIWIVWWHSRLFSTDVGPFLLVQRTFMKEILFECKTANRYSTELNWTPRYFFDMGANEEMGYWSHSLDLALS